MAKKQLAHLVHKKTGLEVQITDDITALLREVEKPALFQGYIRTYAPTTQETDTTVQKQPEEVRVQRKVVNILGRAEKLWSELFNVLLNVDRANQQATADIEIDDAVVYKDVPATFLMTLKTKLENIRKFVEKLPVPSSEHEWELDTAQGLLRSKAPLKVEKTEKKATKFQKAPPTIEHPEQSEILYVDKIVGLYTRSDFSGAVPQKKKTEMLDRVNKFYDAVKEALDTANITTSAPAEDISKVIFDYIFQPMKEA